MEASLNYIVREGRKGAKEACAWLSGHGEPCATGLLGFCPGCGFASAEGEGTLWSACASHPRGHSDARNLPACAPAAPPCPPWCTHSKVSQDLGAPLPGHLGLWNVPTLHFLCSDSLSFLQHRGRLHTLTQRHTGPLELLGPAAFHPAQGAPGQGSLRSPQSGCL